MSRRNAQRRRKWTVSTGAALLCLAVMVVPTPAEADPVPDSCKLHPTQVVNPGCVPAVVDGVHAAVAPSFTYPDLVPFALDLYIDREYLGQDPETGEDLFAPPRVHFATMSQNLGTVALDLLVDDPTSADLSTVSQCVSWVAEVCRERRQVGDVLWHEEHRHFHFQDFARYELRRLQADGSTDYSDAGLIDVSPLVSFCLYDTTPVRDDARPVGTYTGICNQVRQGISPGWADVYYQGLPGQSLSIEGLADGRYALINVLDPFDKLYESNDDNNTHEITIELSGGLTQVVVLGEQPH